jgi:hypothetical protein
VKFGSAHATANATHFAALLTVETPGAFRAVCAVGIAAELTVIHFFVSLELLGA